MGSAPAAWWNGRAMGGEGGQAVVEAAFVLPLTVVLILCTIQIAQLQQARVLVEYAAFNAARAGIVQNGNDGSDGTSGPMHDAAISTASGSTWADRRSISTTFGRKPSTRACSPSRCGTWSI